MVIQQTINKIGVKMIEIVLFIILYGIIRIGGFYWTSKLLNENNLKQHKV